MGIFKKKEKHQLTDEEKKEKDKKELDEYMEKEEKYNDMLRDEAQKQKFLKNMSKIKINTYTKRLVAIIIGVALIDLQLTYVLAFLNKAQIAEALSTQLCITILGVAFVYMIRAYFDSKAEHRNLDNNIKNDIESTLSDKISEVFDAAGIHNVDVNDIIHNGDEDPELYKGFHINKDKSSNDEPPTEG